MCPRRCWSRGPSLSSSACTQQTRRLWTKDEHWALSCETGRVIHTWGGGWALRVKRHCPGSSRHFVHTQQMPSTAGPLSTLRCAKTVRLLYFLGPSLSS